MARNNLARVPKIIEYLERKGVLTVAQAHEVREAIRHNSYPGKFAGDIVVAKGFLKQDALDQHLCERAYLKVSAALDDLRFMRTNNGLQLEEWQKPHFGNNDDINDIRKHITRHGAAAIVANTSRLIVLLAADNPELSDDSEVFEGLLAARDLVQAMTYGDSAFSPLSKFAGKWLQSLKKALVKTAGKAKVDSSKMEKYIQYRFAEIEHGIAQTLRQP